MKKHVWFSVIAVVLFLIPLTQRAAAQGTFLEFDVPGSSCPNPGQLCTDPSGIDAQGTIVGSYPDANQLTHSFYRLANGAITSFDPPGTECPAASSPGYGCSFVNAVKADGTMVGAYFNGTVYVGFLRDAAGHFSTVEAPNVGGKNAGTIPVSISSTGAVTGFYNTVNGAEGFLRDPQGEITTFTGTDLDGGHAVNPTSINSLGEIVGTYEDKDSYFDGFLRGPGGHLAQLGLTGWDIVTPTAAADSGEIVGWYFTGQGYLGFIRDPKGNYTTFAVPGAVETKALGMDTRGTIFGFWEPENSFQIGFYRLKDGTFTSFNEPQAGYGTVPTAIGPHGEIIGYYIDGQTAGHAFILTP